MHIINSTSDGRSCSSMRRRYVVNLSVGEFPSSVASSWWLIGTQMPAAVCRPSVNRRRKSRTMVSPAFGVARADATRWWVGRILFVLTRRVAVVCRRNKQTAKAVWFTRYYEGVCWNSGEPNQDSARGDSEYVSRWNITGRNLWCAAAYTHTCRLLQKLRWLYAGPIQHWRPNLPGGCCICLEQSAGVSTGIAVTASFS